MSKENKITSASTAEYFAKNLNQVGFSSPTKAVLTTVKEAVDNALDACEEAGILPVITVEVSVLGPGATKGSDRITIVVDDNASGLKPEDLAGAFGEYLASSKFGKGRVSRGRQGIGISAAASWALQTSGIPVLVVSKTKDAEKATRCSIDIDLKNNKGILRDLTLEPSDKVSGTRVEFQLDGKAQVNGEAGLLAYLTSTALVNPHLTLHYKLLDANSVTIEAVTDVVPVVPPATPPHPHTLKLGDFSVLVKTHDVKLKISQFLGKALSRVNSELTKTLIAESKVDGQTRLSDITQDQVNKLYSAIQAAEIPAPSSSSVMRIGEEALSKSVQRLGDVDFFTVVSRDPTICDSKPVQVEIAIARMKGDISDDAPAQILRFANRVPLQFDKSSCATIKAIQSVNWRKYGVNQVKEGPPLGRFTFCISISSPFIAFKNASKESLENSDELVAEIRLALMRGAQKLEKYLSAEGNIERANEKKLYMSKFGKILIQFASKITGATKESREKATSGLARILGDNDGPTTTVDLKLQKH